MLQIQTEAAGVLCSIRWLLYFVYNLEHCVSLNTTSWVKSCFLSELFGASGASIKSVLLYLWKDFIQKGIWVSQTSQPIQTFPVQPEQLKWVSRVHLWASGMSLSDCDTPLPNLQSNLQPQNPYQWHRDHLNGSCCGKILCLPPRVKRSRMFGHYSPRCSGRWRKEQESPEECHS